MTQKTTVLLGVDHEEGTEPMSNHSGNRHFADVLAACYWRRTVLKGGKQTAIAGMFGGTAVGLAACNSSSDGNSGPAIGFRAIPISEADTTVVPEG